MRLILLLIFCIPFMSYSTEIDELAVYHFYVFDSEDGSGLGFVVLSDNFPYDEHREQNIIAPENLGEFEYQNDNYHYLAGIYRNRFLKAMNMQETDTLFINNLTSNEISAFVVKDLKLSAFLTPYEPAIPIENYEYLIGFEIDASQMTIKRPEVYSNTFFACVEKTNPFNSDQAIPMNWEKIAKSEFVFVLKDELKPKYMLEYGIGDAYQFRTNDYTYYIQNLIVNEQLNARHLVIIDTKTKNEVRTILYFESEGGSLAPLNGQENSYAVLQYTGQVFKDKSAIVYGFVEQSFGCPYISFANQKEPHLWIKCDNRH